MCAVRCLIQQIEIAHERHERRYRLRVTCTPHDYRGWQLAPRPKVSDGGKGRVGEGRGGWRSEGWLGGTKRHLQAARHLGPCSPLVSQPGTCIDYRETNWGTAGGKEERGEDGSSTRYLSWSLQERRLPGQPATQHLCGGGSNFRSGRLVTSRQVLKIIEFCSAGWSWRVLAWAHLGAKKPPPH